MKRKIWRAVYRSGFYLIILQQWVHIHRIMKNLVAYNDGGGQQSVLTLGTITGARR